MDKAEGALFPKLPLDQWIESFEDFLTTYLSTLFDVISNVIEFITGNFVSILEMIPALVLVVVVALLAWWLISWKLGLFALIGLGLINNLGYWPETLETVSLVIVSVLISMIIGIPIGIWMSQKATVQSIITPILDFMQTMPAFVYLIPAVVFFSLGMVPGVVATIIFSMPPTVRMANLGIRQVNAELVEAAESFGATTGQRLGKVQIPLAMPTIMAGINQTIMLSLSMVVIASMVGAPGLGVVVYRAVTQVNIGSGFEGGLSLVILAMLLDRFTQGFNKK
ncbi:ABC transporter permease [Oceanobacillus sojae]|uniref:ABC transporter permease n=1 Tax=Oceanobacillus sojae TaxID=582851 RepID=UPI0009887B35|nr:proline/glycine betaine ABC transporter permease [Oceanobacillus sojae]MCT1901707.1 proline/glycine betaine ABC transporter permease [Oceanobacillus sojae]